MKIKRENIIEIEGLETKVQQGLPMVGKFPKKKKTGWARLTANDALWFFIIGGLKTG